MKKFYYLVRMTFLEKMAYTKAVWFNTIGTLVSIFSYYFLWKIVFMGENELVGFTMGEMITYVILSKVLSSQFAGGINMQFAEWVYEGTIGTELLRPVTLFYTLFARRSGEFAYFILWKGIPVSFISFFILRGVYGWTSFFLYTQYVWHGIYKDGSIVHIIWRGCTISSISGRSCKGIWTSSICGYGISSVKYFSWEIWIGRMYGIYGTSDILVYCNGSISAFVVSYGDSESDCPRRIEE